jgi:isopentenyl-diphosphate delta-isomerase
MNEQVSETAKRKNEHLQICLDEDVNARVSAGFEDINLKVSGLPELDLDKIDTSINIFGKTLNAPILISSMTGGSGRTKYFNQILARAAESFGIAMGVGSQRAALENKELVESFSVVRKEAPNALLFSNLGVAQLNQGYGIDECQRAVEMIEADGLYLHLNALQEALQPEGDRHFSNSLNKIETICKHLTVPVLVKEVGCGIDRETARKLINVGVKAIDVAGLGGTSWAAVEMYRQEDPVMKAVSANFIDWGIPTVSALKDLQEFQGKVAVISSGGLDSGIDLAKSLALGADLGGFARKFLLAAERGEQVLHQTIEQILLELRISLFCTKSGSISEIKGKWYS